MPSIAEPIPEPTPFDQSCRELRREIKALAESVRTLHSHRGKDIGAADTNEIRANITLAYRHLEDAAMRLGKAIQAFDGGKSVYDP